jgi:hypothetical protein
MTGHITPTVEASIAWTPHLTGRELFCCFDMVLPYPRLDLVSGHLSFHAFKFAGDLSSIVPVMTNHDTARLAPAAARGAESSLLKAPE